jgi:hypothetical protein
MTQTHFQKLTHIQFAQRLESLLHLGKLGWSFMASLSAEKSMRIQWRDIAMGATT